jgi:hypothetical protein
LDRTGIQINRSLVRHWFVAESSFDLEKAFVEFVAVGFGCGTGVLRRDV